MALRDQPYLPLYVQDFLTDEKLIECSASTTGIYIRIMCIMHKYETYGKVLLKQKYKQTGSMCLNFASQLCKHLPYSADEIEKALIELIREKVCYFDEDYLCQKRMIKDNEISEARSKAGKKGGGNPNFVRKLVITKSQTNTEDENEDEDEDEDVIEDEEKTINMPFENFWNLYAKKEDRIKCERKWNNLKNAERELCIKNLPAYIQSTPDRQFRKDPATYLNNKSWENEIIAKSSMSSNGMEEVYRQRAELTRKDNE